jgi:hypothetical protein
VSLSDIKTVEWYISGSQFCSDLDPKLVTLTPFGKDETVDNKTRNWLYYDTANKKPRGVLIAKMQIENKTIFIVEIQRRKYPKVDNDGSQKIQEESLRVFVFVLDNQESFESWITDLLSKIKYEMGAVRKIIDDCPGNADVFKHPSSESDEISCHRAIVNALRKMGISLE